MEELSKAIQNAVLALEYQRLGNSQRGEYVHIDEIRKHVEQKYPDSWTAETITRYTRKLRAEGILKSKTAGVYALARFQSVLE